MPALPAALRGEVASVPEMLANAAPPAVWSVTTSEIAVPAIVSAKRYVSPLTAVALTLLIRVEAPLTRL